MKALQPSMAQIRRATAVGNLGMELGLHEVPGLVLADVRDHDPMTMAPWMPQGQVHVRVWVRDEVQKAGPLCWRAVRERAQGLQVVLEVWPSSMWARVRAWWRWHVWRLVKWSKG